MSASSQISVGAVAPYPVHDPALLHAAIASYATAIPAPAGPAAPEPVTDVPEYLTVSSQAVAAVVAAEMSKDKPVTPRDIAAAELDAGIIFDAERVEAVRAAAYEQAKAEDRAELAQDREARAWYHDRWSAVGRLCEDLHHDDVLKVGDVLAALDGRAPRTLPLTVWWDGTVTDPSGAGPGETILVAGVTARGGRAVLVLDQAESLRLGERLLSRVRPAESCWTPVPGPAAGVNEQGGIDEGGAL